ncbi:MAG: DoxX family protein [Candidatus Sungbacteria bacterium]|uniref:DoxX family protein n=1 Tax=Candidatus Sungiibacteriota bacterium TaxID=2750080 RepID=A0A933DRZ7_9BACT|nr:DoxX family protein [Candidatus Sungbacteria bacterium]
MQPYTKFQETALFALRVIVATIFLYAAYAKLPFWSGAPEGVPAGMVNLIKFLSIVEPLGALALVAGFLTRWAAAGLGIIMVGAIFTLAFTMNVGFFTTPQGVGWDYNLFILGGTLILMAFGAGRWSVDATRKKGGANPSSSLLSI